ncbi:RNA polymerase subunit sigma-70 [Actinoplanes sp. HUAS TT8]|uniref:RNA polymerase subunit sigma-70 n=1 Tax=Actinoplanes sp. HUAS TT8 TaxID=3447453 RepID=UPI003F522ED1
MVGLKKVELRAGAAEFAKVAEPWRREIRAHCYRMLGSAADADDAVQETFLRAWRGFAGFEGRSSARTWLHQIATNVCLRMAEQRARRVLPADLGDPEGDGHRPARAAPGDTRWVGPLAVDPADQAGGRQRIRLAFIAALQHLPARQRGVLLLRDVAEFPAGEVAEMLGMTRVAVNSALLRARDRISRDAPDPDEMSEPGDAATRAVVDRYVEAFERADLGALAAILRADVVLEMPPHATWFAGREPALNFLGRHVLLEPGRFRIRWVPSAANGLPALAMYAREPDGEYRAHALHLIDSARDGIRHIHIFLQPDLFDMFGQPVSLADSRDLPL